MRDSPSRSTSSWGPTLNRTMDYFRPRRFVEMESEVEGDIPPMQAAGIFSRMYIIWATPLIMRAAKEDDMNVDDLWPLRTQDTSQAAQENLTKLWDQEIFAASRENRDPGFKRAVWNFVRLDIYQAFGFKLCFLFCSTLSNSLLLQRVLQFLDPSRHPSPFGLASPSPSSSTWPPPQPIYP